METLSIFTNFSLTIAFRRMHPDTEWVRERVKPLLEKDLPFTHVTQSGISLIIIFTLT